VHLLGFLPEREEQRRIRNLLRKKRRALFVAPTEYHRYMVEKEPHISYSGYPLHWLTTEREDSELKEDLERPFLLFIPNGCDWEELREVFAAFCMSIPRMSTNISLLLALHKCSRKDYETALRFAEEADVLDRLQPVFVEGLSDVGVLLMEASVYVGVLSDGMYPFFELSAAAVGTPVVVLPSSPAIEKLIGYATLAETKTAYALASAIIDARYKPASGERRRELLSTDWSDIAIGIKEALRGLL